MARSHRTCIASVPPACSWNDATGLRTMPPACLSTDATGDGTTPPPNAQHPKRWKTIRWCRPDATGLDCTGNIVLVKTPPRVILSIHDESSVSRCDGRAPHQRWIPRRTPPSERRHRSATALAHGSSAPHDLLIHSESSVLWWDGRISSAWGATAAITTRSAAEMLDRQFKVTELLKWRRKGLGRRRGSPREKQRDETHPASLVKETSGTREKSRRVTPPHIRCKYGASRISSNLVFVVESKRICFRLQYPQWYKTKRLIYCDHSLSCQCLMTMANAMAESKRICLDSNIRNDIKLQWFN